jgi:hypothetical protein
LNEFHRSDNGSGFPPMPHDLETTSPGTSVTQLLSGILGDLQELLTQQLALFRRELRDDVGKLKDATITVSAGVVLCLVAGLMLCFMLAHLLVVLFDTLPLWGSFGLVGGVLAIIGGALVAVGAARFRSFNPLPDESAQALQENVRWIAKPK